MQVLLKVRLFLCVVLVLHYTSGYPQVKEKKHNSTRQIRRLGRQYVEMGPYNGWCRSCACGIPNRMTRVVGGWPTRVNEYPWVVALSLHNTFFCGGTLINDLYVLTAAHCVHKLRSKDLTVVLSEHNKAIMDEAMTETRKVSRIIYHEEFNEPIKYNNDIALLRLSSRVKFRNSVAPACLPMPGEDFSGMVGRVTGWGVTKEKGNVTTILMETQIQVLHEEDCHNLAGFGPQRVSENMMCAGLADGGQDACQGDSGGALLIEDWQGRMTSAGIVSWGLGCGRPKKPGIYTRVSNYLPWIVSHTKEGCYCF